MINGLIPVLLTTFNNDLSIDLVSQLGLINKFEKLNVIERYWLFGTGSEDWAIGSDERIKLLDELEDKFGLEKFIIGTNLGNLQKSKSFAHLLFNRYGNKISTHYMNPYPKYDQSAIVETYSYFMRDNPLSNYAYFSDNFTSDCAPETIAKLSSIKNLCGVKYSTGSGVKMINAKTHITNDFEIIPAVIKTLLSNLSIGFINSTTVEANLFAPQIIKVFNDFGKDINNARVSQDQLLDLTNTFKTPSSKKNFVAMPEMKYVLSKFDICSTIHSPELVPLSAEDKNYLDNLIVSNENTFMWLK